MRMQAKMCFRPSHCSLSQLLKIKGFSYRPRAIRLTTLIDKKRPLSRNPNRGVGVGGTVGMRGVGTLLMHAHNASPKFQLSPRVATVRRRTAALGCWHSSHSSHHAAPPTPTTTTRLLFLQRLPFLSCLPPLPFSCMKHVVITKQTTVSIHIDTINTKIYTPVVLP